MYDSAWSSAHVVDQAESGGVHFFNAIVCVCAAPPGAVLTDSICTAPPSSPAMLYQHIPVYNIILPNLTFRKIIKILLTTFS